jgi:hypothetical protein
LNYYNYFTEIEETFIRRRGKNLLLSPLDWALIESWQEREVPLHIVLRGIERVFDTIDKQPHRKRSVKSLFYCKEEIEAQFAEWLETQVGAAAAADNGQWPAGGEKPENGASAAGHGELFAREAVEAHLEKVAADLARAVEKTADPEQRETFERVLNRLKELAGNFETAEKLEESLEKLDALLDESLLKQSDAAELKAATEKNLAAYRGKMDADVYRRTFDLMILKSLREQSEIPRLSLFYL